MNNLNVESGNICGYSRAVNQCDEDSTLPDKVYKKFIFSVVITKYSKNRKYVLFICRITNFLKNLYSNITIQFPIQIITIPQLTEQAIIAMMKAQQKTGGMNMPTSDDFREYIIQQIRSSFNDRVELTSGDIHRALGGYPGRNHRMASCCSVMYQLMSGDDVRIAAPPSGKGATVTIRYFKHNHF